MEFLKTLGLFAATAVAEIVGCYLPWLWLRQGHSAWLLLPAALSLALFAWLLTCIDPLNSCTGVIVEGNDDEYPDGRRYQALDGQA